METTIEITKSLPPRSPAPPLPGHWPHGRLGEPHPRPPHRCHAHALPRCPGAEGAPGDVVNLPKTMETSKITIFNGKINYKWAIFNSYVSLPEGIYIYIYIIGSSPPRKLNIHDETI